MAQTLHWYALLTKCIILIILPGGEGGFLVCLEKDRCSLVCMLLGVDALLVQKGWLCPCWPKFSLSMVTIGLNLYAVWTWNSWSIKCGLDWSPEVLGGFS